MLAAGIVRQNKTKVGLKQRTRKRPSPTRSSQNKTKVGLKQAVTAGANTVNEVRIRLR